MHDPLPTDFTSRRFTPFWKYGLVDGKHTVRLKIREADDILSTAARQHRAGCFQLEAALQSAHVEGARAGRTDWHAISVLYEGLVRVAPTMGVLVGRAAALAFDRAITLTEDPAIRQFLLRRRAQASAAPDVPDRNQSPSTLGHI